MIGSTLSRYFGLRFLNAVVAVFVGALMLVALVDYIEMLRRTSGMHDVSGLLVAEVTFYRVPFLTERILPFAVLVGAMSCYLNLSRRLELVVARAAGISAWQFIGPAVVIAMLIGAFGTMLYNPISAHLREQSVRLEAEIFKGNNTGLRDLGAGAWVRQRSDDGTAVINAKASRQQGIQLDGVTVFRFDKAGSFKDRIEAASAVLESGYWRLEAARIYAIDMSPRELDRFDLPTSLTPSQVRENFATPETVPFWQLSSYIELSENTGLAATGYRLQYYQLLAQPFYLAGMVLLAAAVSLRFFRFGGVQKMVLSGIGVGFLIYILAKITGDMTKAGLMSPIAAAATPVLVGGLTGLLALLHLEDG